MTDENLAQRHSHGKAWDFDGNEIEPLTWKHRLAFIALYAVIGAGVYAIWSRLH